MSFSVADVAANIRCRDGEAEDKQTEQVRQQVEAEDRQTEQVQQQVEVDRQTEQVRQ